MSFEVYDLLIDLWDLQALTSQQPFRDFPCQPQNDCFTIFFPISAPGKKSVFTPGS